MTLRIREYVYVAVYSSVVPAAEMTARIGLTPDVVRVRGSRRLEPPVPRQHTWQVTCDDRGLQVGEQFERLVQRLRPHQPALRALIDDLQAGEGEAAGAVLQVVRYLDDDDGEAGGSQHRLLGWHLDHDLLRFALDLRAELDVDEYGVDDDA